LAGLELAEALRGSRRRTLALVRNLSDDQWLPARQSGVNPVAWELGHLAWFAEFWILRGPHLLQADGLVVANLPASIVGPDTVFDSARLAHGDRWAAKLPPRVQLLEMMARQLEASIKAIPDGDDDRALYFHRLSLFHEDMHGEAFAWMRAALGYPAPVGTASTQQQHAGDPLRFADDRLEVGPSAEVDAFLFDNEIRANAIALRPFEIDASCVTAGDFLQFVAAGGYDRPEFWPGEAGAWRSASGLTHPSRWRRDGSGWELRSFDRWHPLNTLLPVMHVNAFEAEAYCSWKGRRLPSATEWEFAATNASHSEFAWGNSVWEWTGDAFAPYAGFVAGPYRDYSLPWFGSHRELRGGAFATHARLHNPRYRNFFQPHRTDIFAGFRTAATL